MKFSFRRFESDQSTGNSIPLEDSNMNPVYAHFFSYFGGKLINVIG